MLPSHTHTHTHTHTYPTACQPTTANRPTTANQPGLLHARACVQTAADRIAATARGHAGDADFASPYTREALSQGWV